MRAKTVAEVIAGEAVSGTEQERWNDMLAIASVMYNRAQQLGVPIEDVAQVSSEFNAYNSTLPAGASEYTGLAQEAIDYVKANGPVHNATFYATPAAADNLPSGLEPETSTTGHQFFSDPLGRSIKTAQGFKKPSLDAVGLLKDTASNVGATASNLTRGILGFATDAVDTGAGLLSTAADKVSNAVNPGADVSFESPFGLYGDRLTSSFGTRSSPMGIGSINHKGVDMSLSPGNSGYPAFAAADGVVTFAGPMKGYGNMVEVTHDNGMVSRYGHLGAVNATVGEQIKQGVEVGTVGNTGNSTGPHLHFEIRDQNGVAVNPSDYIDWNSTPQVPTPSLLAERQFPASPALDAANSNFAQGILAQRDYVAPQQAMAEAQPAAPLADFQPTLGLPEDEARAAQMANRLGMYNTIAPTEDTTGLAAALQASRQPSTQSTPFDSILAPTATNVATQSNIVSAYESTPATPADADPAMAAAMGPYTANNLTNSLATSPAALGIVPNPTTTQAVAPSAVASSFQPSGLLAPGSIPNQTLGAYNTNVLGTQYAELSPSAVTNTTPGVAPVDVPQVDVPQVDVPAQPSTATVAAPPQVQQQQQKTGLLGELGITKQGLTGGLLGGLTLGPVGGLIGSLLGNYIAKNPGALGSFQNAPLSINNLGTGYGAMMGVYGPGAQRGNTFTANNGATVTALGNGDVAFTNKYGVKEVHSPDGSVSSVW